MKRVIVSTVNGKAVEIEVEGLETAGELDRLQSAFIEHGALECGYCVPGMILLAKSFLAVNPHPTEDEIRRALASNLCRCTGYVKMTTGAS